MRIGHIFIGLTKIKIKIWGHTDSPAGPGGPLPPGSPTNPWKRGGEGKVKPIHEIHTVQQLEAVSKARQYSQDLQVIRVDPLHLWHPSQQKESMR